MSSDSKAVGQRAHTTFGGDVHPRVCASVSNVVRTCRPARASREDAHPDSRHSTRPDVANFGQKRGRECRGVPELTTRHGEARQLPQRDDEWRLAVALAPARNTGLAISKDAGIQCSQATPSSEAAARTVDAALVGPDPELGMGISSLSAAQRCDDDTVTFQRAWPPRGSTHHHQRWCPQAVGAP